MTAIDAERVRPGGMHVIQARDKFHPAAVPACVFVGAFELPPHAPHGHEFVEIIVIAEGRGTHLGPNGVTDLTPGTVIVVRPGAWHAFGDADGLVGGSLAISPVALAADLSFLRMRAATQELLDARPVSIPARGVWVSKIHPDLAREVIEEMRELELALHQHAAQQLRILGRIITVLGTIASGLPTRPLPTHPAVVRCQRLLESEPRLAWTIAELAQLANLEKTYFVHLFSDQVGVPPIAYLAHVRAERAANLLLNTDLSISGIAAAVGWPDPAYFARRFNAFFGSSPSDYRRRVTSTPADG